MASAYDIAYEEYAREEVERVSKRQKSCSHEWRPHKCTEEGVVTYVVCPKCLKGKEVR